MIPWGVSNTRIQWNGQNVIATVTHTVFTRLLAATTYLHGRIRQKLSVPGTAVRAHGRTLPSGRRLRKGARIYGAVRSKPGEPPRKQRGVLRAGISWTVDKTPDGYEGRVGVQGPSLVYAKVLENGGRRIKQRPYLRKTLYEERTTLRGIMAGGPMGPVPSGSVGTP